MRSIIGRFPSEYGDIAFLQPRDDGVVKACHSVVDRPWSQFGPTRPTSPPKQKPVAGHCLHTGLFLPSLEILGKDPRSGFKIRDTLESRNVVQDASRDDAVFHRQDGTLSGAALHGDQTCYRIAVPHLSIKEDVCE